MQFDCAEFIKNANPAQINGLNAAIDYHLFFVHLKKVLFLPIDKYFTDG